MGLCMEGGDDHNLTSAPEERGQLERRLLENLKRHKEPLKEMLRRMSDHWTYEDHWYRQATT